MSDTQQGEDKKAEAPAPDAPESESQPTEDDQPQEETQESPEAETGQTEETPKDNKAWAAKRVENKTLKEENERLKEALDEVDPHYLESLKGATSPQPVNQPEINPVQDDDDYSKVVQQSNWATQQTAQAHKKIAKLEQQLELQQDRQAEEAYPELKTDKAFQQIVAEKKLAARVLGHDRTTLEIAKEVKGLLGKREEQVAVAAVQETKQQEAESRAAMAESKGNTTGGKSAIANQTLRDKVRRGDQAAETELAKNIMGDLEIT